jgi:FtsH-binding integral membrane protein
MAQRRNRYREMERVMTYALLAGLALFILYLVFAGTGVKALKFITGIITILDGGLILGFLYLTQELKKRRSRWIAAGGLSLVVCTLVSLLLGFPG